MKNDDTTRVNDLPAALVAGLWCGVVVLATIGVVAALARSAFPGDLATRADPFREHLLQALHRPDPFLLRRARELDLVDGRFASHPFVTLFHVLAGGIFLILAPFQFSSRIRARHIWFHRWSGRLLLMTALATALAGLYFGLLMPYGGLVEMAAIAVFGGLFLIAVTLAFVAIRRGRVALHREWMIRALAVALGISTVPLVALALDVALTPAGADPPMVFALSLWTGWTLNIGVAEFWIAYTRPGARSLALPVSADPGA
jgi:uncharacterized membrane protein